MFIGYARVSTADQRLDLQIDALTKAGCERIFTDHASGGRGDRMGLADALSHLRAGDTLVVWKLDRLGRSVRQLVDFTSQLEARRIHFASLTDGIDTGTAAGRFFFHVMAAMAEMERDLVRERTVAGLAAAKARGRLGGRPSKLTAQQIGHAKRLLADPEISGAEVARTLGVARSTLYRSIERPAGVARKRYRRPSSSLESGTAR
jgi:DNA invertase Pin-like site-specific DNA recombinase